jgi:uncharacterized protein YdeI (YjbR/CyaY-like superfamily)
MSQAPENSIHPYTRAGWRAWLEANHTRSEVVWLIYYERATNKPRVEYAEAVEEAPRLATQNLCANQWRR